MVCRAGSAEAAACGEDGRVGEEEADRVVITGHADGRNGGEGEGDGVPDFGLELAAVVGEWNAVVLTACDEDGSGWEDDCVCEDAWIRH